MVCSTNLRAFALLPALFFAAEPARAQSMASSSATVSASGQEFPDRIINGVNYGESTRPINLTPQGINYDDCIADMVLSFNLVLSGFDGAENLQVWASKSSDCTQPADRGVQGSVAATCWPVAFQYWQTGPIYTDVILPFQVRVQDLVGLQNAPLTPPLTYEAQGPAACNAQSSFAAVPLTINFVPVDSNGGYAGTAYHFRQQTDLVGPPAPSGVSLGVGDTLLLATWNLNPDSDTSGYDVFIDPIPGHERMLSSIPDATSLVCPNTGAATSPDAGDGGDSGDGNPSDTGDDGSADGGDDGSADAAVDADAGVASAPVDAGCYFLNVGGSNGAAGTCSSVVLTSAIVQDSGVAVAVESLDDAGNVIDSGTSTTVSGGISTIPVANLVGTANGGVTVADRSTGSYTIRGLKNNITYNVAVAAVDPFGNIGPPSAETCNAPAPIADFWKIYRDDGGKTGGGLCSIETVGAQVPSTTGILLFGGSGALLIRRGLARRRSRRSTLPR